ncbi:MAG: hypothetical protein V1903_14080 [Bacteroidota bacterium]
MKRSTILITIIFIALCNNLDAQVLTGGNFGLNISGYEKTDNDLTTQNSSDFSFSIMPKAGLFLSEKVALGVEVSSTFSRVKSGVLSETITSTSEFGGGPFVRYYAFRWNKFSVFGQGTLQLESYSSTIKTDISTIEGEKITGAYLRVFPGLAYDISDRISLETYLYFLRLNYSYSVIKEGSQKTRSSGFNTGASLDNILSLNTVVIGAIWKF